MRKIFLFLITIIWVYADIFSNISQTQIKQEEENFKAIKSHRKKADFILDTKAQSDKTIISDDEPCFNINKIILNDYFFQKELNRALKKIKFSPNTCLGEKNISVIYEALSNEIILSGYITTSVAIPSQNLKSGILKLEITRGKIDKVIINDTNSTKNRASVFTAFGGNKNGDMVNIRDIEQALENLQNATNGDVGVEFISSDKINFSDIKITRKEKFPISFSLSFDNLGSKATGKYQAGINLSTYNLAGFNEIFYTSYSANLFKGDRKNIGDDGKKGRYDNIYYGFSIPFDRFLLDFNEYRYRYDQAIAGAYSVYKYSGESKRRNLTLSYLYYRNQISKNSLFVRLWEKENKNYIDEFELDNQRRKTAGYEIGLNSSFFIDNGLIAFGATYRKGTGAKGSLKAPEEEYGEGTSRFQTLLTYLNFRKKSSTKPLIYDFKFNCMWNITPLTMQEKFNIGGYYSVRGFDGKMSLAGDRGYYIRNTLEYQIFNNHSIYTVFDLGRVGGQSGEYVSGDTIVGTGLGIKGNFKAQGIVTYDMFVGFPLRKPEYFESSDAALNFTLSYNF